MKLLYTRLLEARKRLGLPWEVLERDYVQSWILAGISRVGSLRDMIVFKGGTALRKCYFGDYRLSEDLDFSGLEGIPMIKQVQQRKVLHDFGEPLDVRVGVYLSAHPMTSFRMPYSAMWRRPGSSGSVRSCPGYRPSIQ